MEVQERGKARNPHTNLVKYMMIWNGLNIVLNAFTVIKKVLGQTEDPLSIAARRLWSTQRQELSSRANTNGNSERNRNIQGTLITSGDYLKKRNRNIHVDYQYHIFIDYH